MIVDRLLPLREPKCEGTIERREALGSIRGGCWGRDEWKGQVCVNEYVCLNGGRTV